MKNFILSTGKYLYKDYFLYNIFKFIMLNANIILHLTLICLNVYFYTIVDFEKFIGLCNVIFSVSLTVSILVHIISYFESYFEEDYYWFFKTYEYKNYFKQIENN